ncbi:hypothetical protein [Pontibacter akesuensis]|uniref:Uncharacterized protein n=1 Tax=Pontibacter akesuensis TaxID=388950 RepID=A0A1I7GFZ6_9BACT|nr:hypothetical protein [Pontibacter akesuensis]GHA57024.1 hypothetical protein GCM10007389_05870 [Pontibacter akesuensis]SFU47379.1 hypothetical protein SAMN04487941_0982 [Pontibacter akesuensis]
MKRLAWIFLVIGAVAQPMGNTGAYLLFQANHAYISKYLCEQREVQGSDCEGSCYLKRKLQKEAEQESQLQQRMDISIPDQLFQLHEVSLTVETPGKATPYTLEVYSSPDFTLFHPPQRHDFIS